jgi:hypothetical protein
MKIATIRDATLILALSFGSAFSCRKSTGMPARDAGTGGTGLTGGTTGGSFAGGGVSGAGGNDSFASGGRNGSDGGFGGGGAGLGGGADPVGGRGGSGGASSGGVSDSVGTSPLDAALESNGICGSRACHSDLEYCCQTPCFSLCLPKAHTCAAAVCSPDDAGFEVYPTDCQLVRPVGPDDPAGKCKLHAGLPNYYLCGPSLLGPPCVNVGLGLNGAFCCP